MPKNNSKKTEQLGMPHGTAAARLKKSVILALLRRHDEDYCFRCGGKIASVDELSFDHKKAWLDVDPKLFWDVDNVGFSHLSCNSRAARKSTKWATTKAMNHGHYLNKRNDPKRNKHMLAMKRKRYHKKYSTKAKINTLPSSNS